MVVPRDDSVFVSAQNVIANTSFVAWKLAKCASTTPSRCSSHGIADAEQTCELCSCC